MCRYFHFIGLLVCIAISGCQGSNESGSISKNIDQQKSTAPSQSNSQTSAVIQAIGRDSTRALDADAVKGIPTTADELMTMLSRYEIEQLREAEANKLFIIHRRRAIASQRLLALQPTLDQKRTAIRIHGDALLRLSQMKDMDAPQQFESFFRQWQNDPDVEIQRTINLSALAFEYSRQSRQRQPDFDRLIQTANGVANRHPNDPIVFRQLSRIGQDCLQNGHAATWLKIAQVLVSVYGTSDQLGLRTACENLQRQMNVARSSVMRIARRIAGNDIGAIQEFRESVEVLTESDLTTSSLQEIGRALLWLERNATVQQALKTNRIVRLAIERAQPLQLKKMLRQNCELRQNRLNWVGEEFDIEAKSARGGRLDWNRISSGRRTIVVFWSPGEVSSIRFVQRMATLYKQNREQKIQLLAINVTQDNSANQQFGEQLPAWEIANAMPVRRTVTENVSTTSLNRPSKEVLRTYGIEILPQLLTIDSNGIVTSVNPDPRKLDQFLKGK